MSGSGTACKCCMQLVSLFTLVQLQQSCKAAESVDDFSSLLMCPCKKQLMGLHIVWTLSEHAQAAATHQPIYSSSSDSGLNCSCMRMSQSVKGCGVLRNCPKVAKNSITHVCARWCITHVRTSDSDRTDFSCAVRNAIRTALA